MNMGKESEKALKEDIEGGMAKELGREEEKRLEQEMSQDMAKELGREEEKRLEQEMLRDMAKELGREEEKRLEQEMSQDMAKELGRESREEQKREMESDRKKGKRRKQKQDQSTGMGKPAPGSRRKKRLTGSMIAKVFAYFLLAAASFVTAGSLLGCILAVSEGFYVKESLEEVFLSEASGQIVDIGYTIRDYLIEGREEYAADYCDWFGVDVDVFQASDMPGKKDYEAIRSKSREQIDKSDFRVWGTYDGSYDVGMIRDLEISFGRDREYVIVAGRKWMTDLDYIFRVYMDPKMPKDSKLGQTYEWVSFLYTYRYTVIWMALAGGMVCVCCVIFLLCGAGHRNDQEGLVPGVLTSLHLEILTAIFGMTAIGMVYVIVSVIQRLDYTFIIWGLFSGGAAIIVLWLTIYLCECALRMKLGWWWQHTLVYVVLRLCYRILRMLARGIRALLRGMFRLFRGIPLVMMTLNIFIAVTFLEFIGCILFLDREGVVLWALEKIVLLVAVLYVAQTCKKLLDASAALAEGEQDHVVDTSRMFGDFKRHGENLNSIGQGISKAVAERMKSEHMKTELITNVSHDLKTPLTSIINYADLICEEKCENPKIQEYAEVLLRQSRRLKKLLEDLLEASKATTGNLEVKLVPCEVGVLLSQAVGEYQQRMEEKNLDLVARQPEGSVQIMADGRHLWRVFDNLLNNICKYAQEHSRVYLTVEQREGQVYVIFRNMSKYPLEILGEELEERFVRGDRSRHMEGNGLGLSIARSLIDLQDGQMQIVTDGDLFKVILTFREWHAAS